MYDVPSWPPHMNRYEPTCVAVCDRRRYSLFSATLLQVRVSKYRSESALHRPEKRPAHGSVPRFKHQTSEKHSLPSLPPTTTITFPTRFAVWYPLAVGFRPRVGMGSHFIRSTLAVVPTSNVHRSFNAIVPLPPPNTHIRPRYKTVVCARRGGGTGAAGLKVGRDQRRVAVSRT